MNKTRWALLSYPLSLLTMLFIGLVVFPLDGMKSLIYLNLLMLTWIILAVWFGYTYFKYARFRNTRQSLRLMAVHILSLATLLIIMVALRLEHILQIGLGGAVVPAVSCFIVFSLIGLACKHMDRGGVEESSTTDKEVRQTDLMADL